MDDELMKLAERVEQAEGPSRELDAAIWWETSEGHTDAELVPRFAHDAAEAWDSISGLVWRDKDEPVPRYTASIDAVMTLVPEGWYLSQMGGARLFGARIDKLDDNPNNFENGISRHNFPLALCAAALRARAHDGGDDEGR